MDRRSSVVRNHDIIAYLEKLSCQRYGNPGNPKPTERSKRTAKKRIDRAVSLRFDKYLSEDDI